MASAFFVLDAEWRFVSLDASVPDLFGLGGELRGRSLWDVAPNLVGSELEEHLRCVVRERRLMEFEARLSSQGQSFSFRALPTADGVAVTLERAPLLRAQAEAVLERIGDAVIALDREYRITYCNTAAVRMYAIPVEAAIGRPLSEIYEYRWSSPQDEAAAMRALAEAGLWRGENVHVRKDGVTLHVDSTVSLIREPDGVASGMLAVIRDVSSERRAAETLRTSERRFRALASHAPVGIFVTDAHGDCSFVNRTWCELAGMTPEQAAGIGWTRALHPDDRERVAAEWYAAARAGLQFSSEYRFRRPDGRVSWLQGGAVELRSDAGDLLGHIGTVSDVTERKLAETALRESEETLRNADRKKDEFLATLAHELRNPLAPLRNGLHVMRLAPDDRPTLLRVQRMMERQLDQMVRLVDDLLDVSRISRGTIELDKEHVELSRVLEDAIETSRPLIEERRHDLRLHARDRSILVHADAARLSQVFANILNNAAKYTSPGGHIDVFVDCQDDYAVVRVSDDGIGISPDVLPRVFDMFTQGTASAKGSPGGLGIGLSIVQRLVEMHGGVVRAASAGPNRGSEFTVRLPLVDAGATAEGRAADPAGEPPRSSALRRRYLVADDNKDAADSLAIWLTLMRGDVRIASDGVEALELAEAFRPEIVLLDIGMPRLDGYDTCRRLRAQDWGRSIIVIAMTGWGQAEDVARSRAAGFDEHLVKPVEPQALEKLLAGYEARGRGPLY